MRSFDSTTGEETWITPPSIVKCLGKFDLDPCAADVMLYRTATRMVTKKEDGLSFDWGNSRVWLNPPYGRKMPQFLRKMKKGIALLPARTDTRWFHELVAPRIKEILFLKGRLRFLKPDGSIGGSPAFASMLCAYSDEDVCCIHNSGLCGSLVKPQAM